MGRFNSKDVLQYLEAYKVEMLMRDIPETKQLSGYRKQAIQREGERERRRNFIR